jgi:hypothetical protein
MNELVIHSKDENIIETYRGINAFKGYQHRTNFVKDENCDLLADSHSIMNRQENYFCQLLNVCRVHYARMMEIHTAKPLVSEPSPLEV